MKTKVSKAQTEVWEWKEKLYNKTKHLSFADRVSYLIKIAEPTISKIKSARKKSHG